MKTYKICRTKDGLVAPPGKLCLVSLDIAEAIPFIKEVSLYVHKTLPDDWQPDRQWTVTDAKTGHSIGKGRTKQDAVNNAKSKILKVGNDKFKEKVNNEIL